MWHTAGKAARSFGRQAKRQARGQAASADAAHCEVGLELGLKALPVPEVMAPGERKDPIRGAIASLAHNI